MESIFGYGEEIINKYGGFELFSNYHIITLLIILAIYIGVPLLLKDKSEKTKKIFRISLGWFMLIQQALWFVYIFIASSPSAETILHEHIPLHLCAVTNIIASIMLLTNSRKTFEIVYFWAIGGGLMSLLTPDCEYSFPHFAYIQTMVHHSFFILAVIYMATVERHKLTMSSFAKSAIGLNLYLLFMLLFNYLTGTNYMYVNGKPDFYTMTDELIAIFGDWPSYLLGFEITGWIIFTLSYIPFGIINLKNSDEMNKNRRFRELIIIICIFFAASGVIVFGLFIPVLMSLYLIIIIGAGIPAILYSGLKLRKVEMAS